jgi:hypothetical protein
LVWSGWVISALSLVAAYGLAASHDAAVWWVLVWAAPTLGCASVGALLCLRAPRNPISWLVLSLGVSQAIGYLLDAYSAAALGLAGGRAAAVAADLIESLPPLVLLPPLLLLFPDGRLPSRRWRPVAVFVVIVSVVAVLSTAMSPGTLAINSTPPRNNPLGIGGSIGATVGVVGFACYVILSCVVLAAAASLATRFRQATGDLRQQLKWIACGAALLGFAAIAAVPLSSVSNIVGALPEVLAATFTVTGVGVAVMRYRLYQIDVIIQKTLVYTALIGSLGLAYLAGIYLMDDLLQTLTGQSSALAVTLSTLAVAAGFRPLQRRIQRAVDHRFYRRKYDAAETLAAFAGRLRDQIELDALSSSVLAVVTATLQPTYASLWLLPTKPHPLEPGRRDTGSARTPLMPPSTL